MKKSIVAATVGAATAAAAAAAFAGGDDAGTDQRAVRAVAEAFIRSVAEGDAKRTCALLTERARDELVAERGECEAVFALLMSLMEEEQEAYHRIKVRRVRVDGDRAEMRREDVDLPPELERPGVQPWGDTRFRQIDGEWKIDA
jgi:uncharacterized protein YhfF